jgi:hypothetical protein
MLTEVQRKQVWEGMLGAEIRANYFADLSGRYARKQRIATWATLAFSSGAVTALIATWPNYIRITLAAITAGISAYSVVMQNQKFAVDSSDLHARWNKIAADYLRLWDTSPNDFSLARLDELIAREQEISKASISFPNYEKLMLKWENHVLASHGLPTFA